MTGRDGVRSLAELLDRFRGSRDVEARSDVRCGYCSSVVERVTLGIARRWFVEHSCVSGPLRLRRRLSAAEVLAESEFSQLSWLLTQRPSGEQWRAMDMQTHYGGVRLGLSGPSAEQVAHAARVNAALVRILGGVPTGRPPRMGQVVEFRPRQEAVTREAAA